MEKSVKVVKAKSAKVQGARACAHAREGSVTFLNAREIREQAALLRQLIVHTGVLQERWLINMRNRN